jgi:hypothetical protein
MAAPNIASVATITLKGNSLALTTSAQTLVNNAASSGKAIIVLSLVIANIDGTNAADVTVNRYVEDDVTGAATAIVSTVSVPADSSLVVIDKNTPVVLEEDDSIGGLASANSDLVAHFSYVELS